MLSASREGVLADRAWNKWLRDDCLAPLLAGPALELLKRRQADGAFLAYLPVPGELAGDSFMAPLEPALLAQLKSQPCVMAHDGAWCRPAEVLLPAAPFLLPGRGGGGEPLLPGGMLARLAGLRYAHPGLLAADGRAAGTLRRLGVGSFGPTHLVQCLSHVGAGAELAAELARRTTAASSSAVAWLAQLYDSLDKAELTDAQWQQLKASAPILLLQDGSLVRGQQGCKLWDPSLGPDDLQLFMGAGLPVLSLAVAAELPGTTVNSLVQRLGVERCGAGQLVQVLLGWPAAASMAQLLPRLRFLARHTDVLPGDVCETLTLPVKAAAEQTALQLLPANRIYMPAGDDALIQQDLEQARMRFLHPDLVAACRQERQLDRLMREFLTVYPPPADTAAKYLLALHASKHARAALGADGMWRHVRYLATCLQQLSPDGRKAIAGGMWLPVQHTAGGGSEPYCASSTMRFGPAADLQLPPGLQLRLVAAGALFLDPGFQARAGADSPEHAFLRVAAGVRECSSDTVALLLLDMYNAQRQVFTPEQDLQHLTLLSWLRPRLSSSTLHAAAEAAIVPVEDSQQERSYADARRTRCFLPTAAPYAAVRHDVEKLNNVQFVSPDVMRASAKDAVLRQFLSQCIGVKEMGHAEVLQQLLAVHDAVFARYRRPTEALQHKDAAAMVCRHLAACGRALQELGPSGVGVPAGFGSRFRLPCNGGGGDGPSGSLSDAFRCARSCVALAQSWDLWSPPLL